MIGRVAVDALKESRDQLGLANAHALADAFQLQRIRGVVFFRRLGPLKQVRDDLVLRLVRLELFHKKRLESRVRHLERLQRVHDRRVPERAACAEQLNHDEVHVFVSPLGGARASVAYDDLLEQRTPCFGRMHERIKRLHAQVLGQAHGLRRASRLATARTRA